MSDISIIFDVDSTLCAIEGIDELARMKGVNKRIEPLTAKAMNGELTLEQVFSSRLTLINPTNKDLQKLGELYCNNLTLHCKTVLNKLRTSNYSLFIVSGGYTEAIYPLGNLLGIPKEHIFANALTFDELGNYCGFDKDIPLWKEKGKNQVIKELPTQGKTILVGDGMSDAEARDVVDTFIGFGGVSIREKVKEYADYYITDIQDLLPIVENL